MSDYHTVYKDLEGTTTEWEDLQVKFGNWKPREKPKPAPPWEPTPDEKKPNKEWLDEKTPEELEELDDELDDDTFLEEYRLKRIAELKNVTTRPKFGTVEQIKGQDFVRDVSQASPDVWVVVHLFKPEIPECAIMQRCLDKLAEKYPNTKMVKIISTDCIKNYPDFNLPTLLVYNASQVKANLVGLRRFGGQKCTAEDVAFALSQVGPVLSNSESMDKDEISKKIARDYLQTLITKREQEEESDNDAD